MGKNLTKALWSLNIKFLRLSRNLSQQALATQLGFSRSKLNALENGSTRNPLMEDVIKLSKFFNISVDNMLELKLASTDDKSLEQLRARNDLYQKGADLRVLAITVDKNNLENVDYVPVKATAGYSRGFSDPDYIASLPKVSLPNLPPNQTFRMFGTTGDSMIPIPEDSEIIAQYVQNWNWIKANTPCIVVLKQSEGLVFKQVTVQDDGNVTLRSFNKLYTPYVVRIEEIQEIWKFYGYFSKTLPDEIPDMRILFDTLTDLKVQVNRMVDKK